MDLNLKTLQHIFRVLQQKQIPDSNWQAFAAQMQIIIPDCRWITEDFMLELENSSEPAKYLFQGWRYKSPTYYSREILIKILDTMDHQSLIQIIHSDNSQNTADLETQPRARPIISASFIKGIILYSIIVAIVAIGIYLFVQFQNPNTKDNPKWCCGSKSNVRCRACASTTCPGKPLTDGAHECDVIVAGKSVCGVGSCADGCSNQWYHIADQNCYFSQCYEYNC